MSINLREHPVDHLKITQMEETDLIWSKLEEITNDENVRFKLGLQKSEDEGNNYIGFFFAAQLKTPQQREYKLPYAYKLRHMATERCFSIELLSIPENKQTGDLGIARFIQETEMQKPDENGKIKFQATIYPDKNQWGRIITNKSILQWHIPEYYLVKHKTEKTYSPEFNLEGYTWRLALSPEKSAVNIHLKLIVDQEFALPLPPPGYTKIYLNSEVSQYNVTFRHGMSDTTEPYDRYKTCGDQDTLPDTILSKGGLVMNIVHSDVNDNLYQTDNETQLIKIKKELSEAKSTIDKLTQEKDESIHLQKDLQAQLSDKKNTIDQLSQNNNEKTHALATLREDLSEAQNEIEQFKRNPANLLSYSDNTTGTIEKNIWFIQNISKSPSYFKSPYFNIYGYKLQAHIRTNRTLTRDGTDIWCIDICPVPSATTPSLKWPMPYGIKCELLGQDKNIASKSNTIQRGSLQANHTEITQDGLSTGSSNFYFLKKDITTKSYNKGDSIRLKFSPIATKKQKIKKFFKRQ